MLGTNSMFTEEIECVCLLFEKPALLLFILREDKQKPQQRRSLSKQFAGHQEVHRLVGIDED